MHALVAEDITRQEAALDALQFLRRNRLRGQLGQLFKRSSFGFAAILPLQYFHLHAEPTWVPTGAVVRTDGIGELIALHQALIEPTVLAVAENRLNNVEDVIILLAHGHGVETDHQAGRIELAGELVAHGFGAHRDGRGLLALGQVRTWNVAEELLHQREGFVGIEPADDDDGRVVRVVPQVVVPGDDLGSRTTDVLLIADHRVAVRVLGIEQPGQDGLVLQFPRAVFAALEFGNHGPFFLLELVLGVDLRVPHTVGFDLQGLFPTVRGEVEVINRHVFGGVRIVPSTVALGGAVDVARLELVGAFEKQVFEVMAQAGLVLLLVTGADLVGHHRGDHRAALHRQQVNLQAVVECHGLEVLELALDGFQELDVGVVGVDRGAEKHNRCGSP